MRNLETLIALIVPSNAQKGRLAIKSTVLVRLMNMRSLGGHRLHAGSSRHHRTRPNIGGSHRCRRPNRTCAAAAAQPTSLQQLPNPQVSSSRHCRRPSLVSFGSLPPATISSSCVHRGLGALPLARDDYSIISPRRIPEYSVMARFHCSVFSSATRCQNVRLMHSSLLGSSKIFN